METIVWQVELFDGRIFRIFCANRTQKQKVINSYYKFSHLCKEITVITSGLHTLPQWEKILRTI